MFFLNFGFRLIFDLIIVNYNTPQLTLDCIKSARETCADSSFNIIVIDNNSTDNSIDLLKKSSHQFELIESKINLGYGGALNEAAKSAKSNILILSNSDIIFLDNSIQKLIEPIETGYADITGPQQLYTNYKWQESYSQFPGLKLGLMDFLIINSIKRNLNRRFFDYRYKHKRPRKVDFVDGAILAVRKDLFDSISGFDTAFKFYSEETDFCYRATQKGAKIYHIPNSKIIHYRGASYSQVKIPIDYLEKMIYSKLQFCKKYKSDWETKCYFGLEKYHYLNLHIFRHFINHSDKKYGENYYEVHKLFDKVLNEI